MTGIYRDRRGNPSPEYDMMPEGQPSDPAFRAAAIERLALAVEGVGRIRELMLEGEAGDPVETLGRLLEQGLDSPDTTWTRDLAFMMTQGAGLLHSLKKERPDDEEHS